MTCSNNKTLSSPIRKGELASRRGRWSSRRKTSCKTIEMLACKLKGLKERLRPSLRRTRNCITLSRIFRRMLAAPHTKLPRWKRKRRTMSKKFWRLKDILITWPVNLRKWASKAIRSLKNVIRSSMSSIISRISHRIKRATRLSCRGSSPDWRMIRSLRLNKSKHLSTTTKHSNRKDNSKSRDSMSSNKWSNRSVEPSTSMRCKFRICREQTEMQNQKLTATNSELKACNSTLRTTLSMGWRRS